MEFFELAAARYSVRDFLPAPVETEKLTRILETGRLAPTAHNKQSQRIFVVQTPELLEKLKEATPCTYGAPVVLVVGGSKSEASISAFDGSRNACEMDATIVATHMMLQAAELGLGSTWVCHADLEKVKELLALPEDITLHALINVGYASEKGVPSAWHTARKPLEETVSFL